MPRKKIEIGDVFEVMLDNDESGYFQWIAIDDNQLRSDVIRVFSTDRAISAANLEDLKRATVSFYAHCVIPVGIRLGVWKRIASMEYPDHPDVIFRSSLDFGRDEITISERWNVWKINGPKIFVGRLHGDLVDAEPGEVFPPAEILYRMQNGHYRQPYQR